MRDPHAQTEVRTYTVLRLSSAHLVCPGTPPLQSLGSGTTLKFACTDVARHARACLATRAIGTWSAPPGGELAVLAGTHAPGGCCVQRRLRVVTRTWVSNVVYESTRRVVRRTWAEQPKHVLGSMARKNECVPRRCRRGTCSVAVVARQHTRKTSMLGGCVSGGEGGFQHHAHLRHPPPRHHADGQTDRLTNTAQGGRA